MQLTLENSYISNTVQVPIVEIIYCRVCHREPLLRTRFLHVLRRGEVGKYHTEGEIFRHGTIGGWKSLCGFVLWETCY